MKKINIDERIIELGYEGFNFSKKAKNYLTYHNLEKATLITLTEDDFRNNYYDERYKGYLYEIADVLKENGYPNLYEEIHAPSAYELEMIALGYVDDFKWSGSFSWDLKQKNISLTQLCEMTYDDLRKFDGIGHERIALIKSELDRFGYKNNIILPLSPKEQKAEREKYKKELIEKLITLLFEQSNLEPKNNPYDKWIISEYKKSLKELTVKSLESRLKQLKELE